VGVGRQNDIPVCITTANERPLQLHDARVHPIDGIANPQPQVGTDLVVTTTSSVQFAAHIPQAVDERPFDVE
jgi:hypothetical protein